MVTDQETIEILNSWKDAVLDSKTKEAFDKAIKAVKTYEQYDWIFGGINDPEWNIKFDAIDEALGIHLFYWQKHYIVHGCMRQTGFTTASIIRKLLDVKNVPWDISYMLIRPKEHWYYEEIKKIKTKLDNAGIPTRTVFFCKEDKNSMIVNFDKAFKPTIEDEIRSYEKLLELHKEQIGQCSTCVYYLSPVNSPIVTDCGRCQLSEPNFYDRIFDQSIDCANYEEDTTSTVAWEKILKTLKEKEK